MNSIGGATPAIPVFTTSAFVGTPDRMLFIIGSQLLRIPAAFWDCPVRRRARGCLPAGQTSWDTLNRVNGRKRNQPKPDLSDAEVRTILVNAMAEVGADSALVYAFRKTGVYVCEENEKRLSNDSLRAFDAALDEYYAALARPIQ
jgi:hypothetical protein